MKFVYPIFDRALQVSVIGAGGTGSAIIGLLAQMAVALPKLGHPGLDVQVWDDDTVSHANIGRQAFAPGDIGLPKADVLVNRVNAAFGLRWTAVVHRFTSRVRCDADVLIGAVDSRTARAGIYECFRNSSEAIWIDCGNSATTGQVVLGARRRFKTVVPCVADLFPEIIDVRGDERDTQPSCSVAEALIRQDLLVNRFVADSAINLLWRLVRHGEIEQHGVFIDVASMRMTPMAIGAEHWAQLGWTDEQQLPRAA